MAKLRINPEILKYELEYTKLSIEELSFKTGISLKTLQKALEGERALSYQQLLKIANLFRRPTWYFFGDRPLKDDKLKDFRKKDSSIDFLKVVQIVREVKQFQNILEEISEEIGYASNFKVFTGINTDKPPKELADAVRGILKLPDFSNILTYKDALDIHKQILESFDILIFEEKLTENSATKDLKAISVHHPHFPAIVLNKDDSLSSKIFSLYHELGHILKKSTTVCEYEEFEEDKFTEEQFCNAFSGHFLVPTEELLEIIKNLNSLNESTIEKIATYFKVSPFVILRRLKGENIIGEEEFSKYEESFKKKSENRKEESKPIAVEYYIKVFNRVSKKALSLLFEAVAEKILDEDTLMKILHIRKKEQLEKLGGKVYEALYSRP